jgi:hypothetical protein
LCSSCAQADLPGADLCRQSPRCCCCTPPLCTTAATSSTSPSWTSHTAELWTTWSSQLRAMRLSCCISRWRVWGRVCHEHSYLSSPLNQRQLQVLHMYKHTIKVITALKLRQLSSGIALQPSSRSCPAFTNLLQQPLCVDGSIVCQTQPQSPVLNCPSKWSTVKKNKSQYIIWQLSSLFVEVRDIMVLTA